MSISPILLLLVESWRSSTGGGPLWVFYFGLCLELLLSLVHAVDHTVYVLRCCRVVLQALLTIGIHDSHVFRQQRVVAGDILVAYVR